MTTADFSTNDDTDEFEPLQRAKDRLSIHIFNNYSVLPTEEELSKMIREVLPYIACHLALFQANEAAEEIVKRSSGA